MLYSCISRVDGCLDPSAENFDLDADRNCDDCCRYPSISISLSQKWDEENFNTDSVYHDVLNKPFRIIDLRYLLSSFSWSDANMKVYTIDSASINCNTELVRYTSDLILVESRRFTYNLDTIKDFPFIENVSLKVGLDPGLSCVDADDINTPLLLSDRSILWDSITDMRAAIRVILQKDTTIASFDTVFINSCIPIDIDYTDEFALGLDKRLDITVDYALWFATFNSMNINTIYSSFETGIPVSFTRTP